MKSRADNVTRQTRPRKNLNIHIILDNFSMLFLHLPALTHPSDVDVLFLHIWRCTALSSLVFVWGEMKEMRKKIRFLLSLRSSFLVVLLLLPICCFIHIGLSVVCTREGKNSNFDQRSLSRKKEQRHEKHTCIDSSTHLGSINWTAAYVKTKTCERAEDVSRN